MKRAEEKTKASQQNESAMIQEATETQESGE